MFMTKFKKSKSFLVSMMLIAAMAFGVTACGSKNNTPATTETAATETAVETVVETAAESETAATEEVEATVVGEGAVTFNFTVVDADQKTVAYEVHTDAATVGEALLALDLIAGEDGEYGLYVKTVNGVTVDYDTDGKYWAFYVDGEYATAGVDSTDVVEGATYSFVVE